MVTDEVRPPDNSLESKKKNERKSKQDMRNAAINSFPQYWSILDYHIIQWFLQFGIVVIFSMFSRWSSLCGSCSLWVYMRKPGWMFKHCISRTCAKNTATRWANCQVCFFQSSGGKIDGVNSSKNNTLIYQLIMLRDPSCPSSNSAAKESFSIKRK